MTDIFVTRMRNLCNSMSEAIILGSNFKWKNLLIKT